MAALLPHRTARGWGGPTQVEVAEEMLRGLWVPGGHTGLHPSLVLAGFRDESVLPHPAFGQTSSCFAALVVISVVS